MIPLSHPQQRVWFTERLYPGTGVGNLGGCLHFPGNPEQLPTLASAICQVVARHEALRLRLARTSASMCHQYFGAPLDLDLPVLEVDESRHPLLEESRRPFRLFDAPLVDFRLLRLPQQRIGFFFKYHHITIDALSVSLLNREIYQAYAAGGSARDLPPVAPFTDFLGREREYLTSETRERDAQFWREQLRGLKPPSPAMKREQALLANDSSASSRFPLLTQRYEHEFEAELGRAIVSYCDSRRTSIHRFFLAIFALFVSKQDGSEEVVIGTGHHNRLSEREKSMVGMTVSTLPIRLTVRADESFVELVGRVRDVSKACFARQQYPYDLLSRQLREEGVDPKSLLRWFVNHVPSVEGQYEVERYTPGADLAHFNVKINPNQRPKAAPLQLGVDARLALYDERQMRHHFREIERLVRQALLHPETPWGKLETEVLRSQGVLFGGRVAPAPSTALAFEDAAARFAGEVALVDPKGTLTYGELSRCVAVLRDALRQRGIGRGQRVVVLTARSAEFVIAVLAVMGCGAAYIPVDDDLPEGRLQQILADAEPALLLTDRAGRLASSVATPVLAASSYRDAASEPERSGKETPQLKLVDAEAIVTPHPEDPAYVIYTSGSTGTPKGVVVPHRALSHLCQWNAELLDVSPKDRAAAFCSFSFDVSVAEIFVPLLRGATLHLLAGDTRHSVHALGRYFEQHGITLATFPTRVGELFVAHVDAPTLRLLTVAGERLRPIEKPGYRVINAYGPTEATVYATTYEVQGGEDDVPIGLPTTDMAAYVVDDFLQLVPHGTPGELVLAGTGVALGYLNRQDLTRESFVANPFRTGLHDAMAYRTGDIVREAATGLLHYVGRRDRQLKLRGFRVEPEEVERRLLAHPNVVQCRALGLDDGAEVSLIAFCVLGGDRPITEAPDEATLTQDNSSAASDGARGDGWSAVLREYAASHLPPYMVPQRWFFVAELPLNRHGKVDENALLELLGRQSGSPSPASGASASLEPKGTGRRERHERQMLAFFRDALGCTSLGPFDSFFEHGGDSLRAMRLFARIEAAYGEELPVSLIFQFPTAAGLARALSTRLFHEHDASDAVLMKSGDTSECLFCIHEFSGDVMPYTYLAKGLKFPGAVYGIRWSHKADGQASTLQQLAANYLRSARIKQPVGPYHLLGYSIGGLIAYEMAHQLLGCGEQVGFLGLVDTPNPGLHRGRRRELPIATWRNVVGWLRGMSLAYKIAYLTSAVGRIPSLAKIRTLRYAQSEMKRLAMAYQPEPLPCSATLFRSRDPRHGFGEDLGWQLLVDNLEIEVLASDHAAIMNEKHSQRIARHVEAAVSAGAAPSGSRAVT